MRIVACVTALLACGSLQASNFGPGVPTGVVTYRTGYAIVNLPSSATRSAMPACATSSPMIFVTNTPEGKSLLATILTAYAAGKNITLNGAHTCNLFAGYEDLHSITTD